MPAKEGVLLYRPNFWQGKTNLGSGISIFFFLEIWPKLVFKIPDFSREWLAKIIPIPLLWEKTLFSLSSLFYSSSLFCPLSLSPSIAAIIINFHKLPACYLKSIGWPIASINFILPANISWHHLWFTKRPTRVSHRTPIIEQKKGQTGICFHQHQEVGKKKDFQSRQTNICHSEKKIKSAITSSWIKSPLENFDTVQPNKEFQIKNPQFSSAKFS